jgi:hypothetical protein
VIYDEREAEVVEIGRDEQLLTAEEKSASSASSTPR